MLAKHEISHQYESEIGRFLYIKKTKLVFSKAWKRIFNAT